MMFQPDRCVLHPTHSDRCSRTRRGWLAASCVLMLISLGCDRSKPIEPIVKKPDELAVEVPSVPSQSTAPVSADPVRSAETVEPAQPVEPSATAAKEFPTDLPPAESVGTEPRKETSPPPAKEMARAEVSDDLPLTPPAKSETKSATNADGPPMTGDDVRAWENWPAPQALIVITGQQNGYIEPCGCTGLENQKGGMARRHTLFNQIAAKGWPMVPVDSGNQVRKFGPQSAIKFQTAVDGLKEMQYRAVGLGAEDLRLGVENLLVVTADSSGPMRFVSANVSVYDPELMAKIQVVEAGGRKIGITTAMSSKFMEVNFGSDIKVSDPVEGLRKAHQEMTDAGCGYRVLLWYGNNESAAELLKEIPEWDLIVLGDDEHEPPYQPGQLPGSKALILPVGHKGMNVCMLGLYDDAEKPIRYARIPLTDDFDDSPEMLKRLASYQKQLEAVGLEGLGLRPVPHPTGGKFVGTEKCAECHTQAFAVWEKTEHASATESLVHPPNKRGEIARHFDPECLSCHVTGWNPQSIYPYQGGYLSLTETPKLIANGCENCHGPGEEHAAVESGDIQADDERTAALRVAMRLPLEKAREKCLECHDIDNSPDFHKEGAFEKYWADVAHKGLD